MYKGCRKPQIALDDLQRLYNVGIELEVGYKNFTCIAMLAVGTKDLQAKSAVLNMTQHNGEYSCVYYMEQCQVVQSGKGYCPAFPYKDNPSII